MSLHFHRFHFFTKLFLCLFFILSGVQISFGQTSHVQTQEFKFTGNIYKILDRSGDFDALVLRFEGIFPEDAQVVDSHGNKYPVTRDEHQESYLQSNLILFPDHQTGFSMTGLREGIKGKAYFIKVPEFTLPESYKGRSSACTEPTVVPQSVWRAGLNPPTPGRKATPTRHCIVHHSASSNSDTNSVKLVRAFYIQHTEVNGWDDIGYNYLIGHDGTIFAGRDPEKPGIEQDNVFGAHFCGKNSYTMGVCVIGNFQEEAPDPRAVDALEHLLSWKMFKDRMNPLESLHHPDTVSGPLLPVLAGHRNGCSTECPGQFLFDMIPQLRLDIRDNLVECNKLDVSRQDQPNILIYPNPSGDEITISTPHLVDFAILNINGKIIKQGRSDQYRKISINSLPAGVYFVHISDNRQRWIRKLIVNR